MDLPTKRLHVENIKEGDRFVSLISSQWQKKTFRPEVITDIGSFNSLFKLDTDKYKQPVLVSGTDGVGTKLKIAFMTDKHDNIRHAGPLWPCALMTSLQAAQSLLLSFLDYFATGKLKPEKGSRGHQGRKGRIKQAGCSLTGGDPEMPTFYPRGRI